MGKGPEGNEALREDTKRRGYYTYTVKRNTGRNANVPGWAWLVIDEDGFIIAKSDLASVAQDHADLLNRRRKDQAKKNGKKSD